jgi:ApaG protein
MQKGHSDTVTEGVRVRVGALYVPEQSDPDRGRHLYAYRVEVINEGDAPVRLLSRHWIILDAIGERRDVRGPGVVGQQPLIEPGGTFEYTSGCQLETSWGTMEGSYQMERADGTRFDAAIGRFFLAQSVAPPTRQGAGRS